ncbi:hypothetical protein MUU53_16570 [Rhizobium lemnae]|uniref:Uncharacterized protein n=1 Tax=Rhizobium lemnae TaxID=1214924 RepID=A0ABV8E7T8_9HYPH|nr:hypothetical protein [Rhizobium lemnae]MCJ8509522.1 hypothetical protein [Rhizobium lemnae]
MQGINTPEAGAGASPAVSLGFLIAAYRASLADFNSRSFETDEASEAFAEASFEPLQQMLANWSKPAATVEEARAALQLTIDELRGSAGPFLTLPMVTAVLGFLSETDCTTAEPEPLETISVGGLFQICDTAENARTELLEEIDRRALAPGAEAAKIPYIAETERLRSRSDDLMKLSMAAFDAALSQDCQTLDDAALKMKRASEWLSLRLESDVDYAEDNQRILASFLPLFRKSGRVESAAMTIKARANG